MPDRIVALLIRRRTLLLAIVPLSMLLLAEPLPPAYAAGVGLALLGQAMRFWAAGYIVKQEQLATTGPYACVRNPLYVGSLLITLGWGAMSGRPLAAAILVGAYFLTHLPTIWSEERYLRARYGAEFDGYCRRVPRLLPRGRCARAQNDTAAAPTGQPEGFSWRLALERNQEGKYALGVLLLACVYGILLWQ